jgi:hypothetical protein
MARPKNTTATQGDSVALILDDHNRIDDTRSALARIGFQTSMHALGTSGINPIVPKNANVVLFMTTHRIDPQRARLLVALQKKGRLLVVVTDSKMSPLSKSYESCGFVTKQYPDVITWIHDVRIALENNNERRVRSQAREQDSTVKKRKSPKPRPDHEVVLAVLRNHNGTFIRMEDLARILDISKSTLGAVLNEMKKTHRFEEKRKHGIRLVEEVPEYTD